MSLRIKHLNGDTSFLLIFSPANHPHNPQGTLPGSFTILIDPWVSPLPSTYLSPKFAITHRVMPACIESLADLPDPNLVLLSQEKTDHCHEETLRQLPPSTKAKIMGPASAARKIKSWHHFAPDSVRALHRFDEKHLEETIYRIPLPALSSSGTDGEVTIALLAHKIDMKGMHNALAITYRPPSASPSSTPLRQQKSYHTLPTPPSSPSSISSPLPQFPPTQPPEPTLSTLYTPHGIPLPLLIPYTRLHLLPQPGALPLTALFHALSRASNPWFLGGNILTGYPGGLEIARLLRPRVWVSAHDERKVNKGVSVRRLRSEGFDVEVVKRALDGEDALEELVLSDDDDDEKSAGAAASESSLSLATTTTTTSTTTTKRSSRRTKSAKAHTLLLEMESGEEFYLPPSSTQR